jgi:NAD(P)-dependent dehydrogenase (short-subunit alcohol dehydrogenase family)
MQTALITGASQGLGRALATALAEKGVRVVLVARRPGPLKEIVHTLRQAGHDAHGIPADVATIDPARLIGEATALVGPLDLVVHNASTLGPTPLRSLLDTDDEAFQAVLDVNLLGPFRLTRAAAGAMALRGEGTVLFVSSDAAVEAYPTWGAYGVSKAAADQLANVWAEELPQLRFLAVDPGEMDTAMHAAAVPDADPTTLQTPAAVALRILALLEGDAHGRLAA